MIAEKVSVCLVIAFPLVDFQENLLCLAVSTLLPVAARRAIQPDDEQGQCHHRPGERSRCFYNVFVGRRATPPVRF